MKFSRAISLLIDINKGKIAVRKVHKTARVIADVVLIEDRNGFINNNNSPMNPKIECTQKVCGCRLSPFIWVYEEKKLIYLENPKVASTTFKKVLDLRVTPITLIDHYKKTGGDHKIYLEISKTPMEEIQSYVNEGWNASFVPFYGDPMDLPDDYFAFGVIRNPYERFISNYKMFNEKEFMRNKLKSLIGTSFKKFSIEDFSKLVTIYKNHHWDNQSNFLSLDNKEVAIIRFDRIQEQWKPIAQKYGFNEDLPMTNPTSRKVVDFNESVNEILRIKYADDIELFNRLQ